MNHRELEDLLLYVLKEPLRLASRPETSLPEDLNLLESGILDSIAFLELLARLEKELNRELDLFEYPPEEFTSVGGLLAHLERICNP